MLEPQTLTAAVTPLINRVCRMREKLCVGHMLLCPHCRKWHTLVKWHTSGTLYTIKMLYFECEGQRFYAGHEGLESRHETRAASNRA